MQHDHHVKRVVRHDHDLLRQCVHVIPVEEKEEAPQLGNGPTLPRRSLRRAQNDASGRRETSGAVVALQQAAAISKRVTSAIIQREAVSLNNRLISLERDTARLAKRRRLEEILNFSGPSDASEVSSGDRLKSCVEQGASSLKDRRGIIYADALRTKRMAVLLQHIEVLHSTLVQEVQASLDDGQHSV